MLALKLPLVPAFLAVLLEHLGVAAAFSISIVAAVLVQGAAKAIMMRFAASRVR